VNEPDVPLPKPPSLFRNRDYLLLWSGDAVSTIGTSISTIGYPLLILFTTGSYSGAGLVTAAGFIGSTVPTLLGGALADRVSRKAILALTAVAQAIVGGCVAALVASGHHPLSLLAAAALVSGIAAGMGRGAQVPTMRRIVPPEQMSAAYSQIEGRDMAAQLLGNPLGSILFAVARWLPFGADAVSFLFAAAGAVLIRRPLGPERAEKYEGPGYLSDVASGVRYVLHVPFLRYIAVWSAVANIALTAYSLLLVMMLRYRGADPTTIGFMISIALIGGVAGAVAAQQIVTRLPARVVFLLGNWGFGAGLVLVAVLQAPWEIALAALLSILLFVPMVAALSPYEIGLVPDEFSGRVSAVMMFSNTALTWAGPLVAGFVAGLLDPPAAALIFGGIFALIAVVSHLAPSLRLLNTPVSEVKEFVPPEVTRASASRLCLPGTA